jgi:uncharacterized protein YbaP (TraB family)
MPSYKNSLLWEIRLPDSVRRSYIYGTMHVKDQKAFTHVEKAILKLQQCNLVACEYNLEEARGLGMADEFLLPDNNTLEFYVGAKKYEKWKRVCHKAFKVNLDRVNRFMPLMIVNMLSESLLQMENGVSLDQYIWEKGIENGLALDGVESFDGQKSIMRALGLDYQLKMLKQALANVSKFKKGIDKLLKLYTQQEIHQLYKTSKGSLGKYRKLMLYDRNHRMADSIVNLATTNNAFVAIGAAHLSGKKGVLHLLKKQGVKLTPCP